MKQMSHFFYKLLTIPEVLLHLLHSNCNLYLWYSRNEQVEGEPRNLILFDKTNKSNE